MALPKLFQRIFWHNNTTPAINEDNLNAMSKAIDDIDDRVIALGDDVMTVVPQIQAYLEQAEDLVEAMELLSQNPPYIGANGNWYVWDTNTSAFVDSGVDASISVDIADITMLAPDATPSVTNTGTATDPIFHLFIPRGQTGNGISTIAKTGTSGLVDTYTITMTNGTTSTFTVTNGAGDMNKSVYDADNAVANAGGIKAFVNDEVKDVYEVMGQNGAKNYLIHPSVKQTSNNVTFNVNSDKSVTVNRTDTSSGNSYYNSRAYSNQKGYSFTLEPGVYIFSGGFNSLPSGINSVYLARIDGTTFINCNNGPAEFTVTETITLIFTIYCKSTSNPSDVTIYPMIRLASDTDPTYQPFAETNQQLTLKTDGLWDNMMDSGAVNLFKNTLTSQTINGVTCTISSDDTFLANGTATAQINTVIGTITGLSGKYRLTGCPSGGSGGGYQLQIQEGTTYFEPGDYGNGFDYTFDASKTYYIRLVVRNGIQLNNLTFKPMLSDPALNLSYDDYVPYAMTNRKLTKDFNRNNQIFGKMGGVYSWNTTDTFTRSDINMKAGYPRLLIGGRGSGHGFAILLCTNTNEYVVLSDPESIIQSFAWTLSNDIGSFSIKFAKTYGSVMSYAII